MVKAAEEQQRLQGIAQLLVHENLMDKAKVIHYQNLAQTSQLSLLQYLVTNNLVPAEKIALMVAQHFAVPIIDLDAVDFESIPAKLVNEKLIRRHGIVPLFTRGNHLFVAADDPGKQAALKEIQFHTGLHTNTIVVEADKLNKLIDKILKEKDNQGLMDYVDNASELDILEISADNEELDKEAIDAATEDAPVVKFVNKILVDAIKKGVSDIHFESFEKDYRIRYRLDGILTEVACPPISLSNRITSRIKIMSNLDISERRIPQDGRFKMKLSPTRSIDFRVSTCPTISGEKVVMRILDPGSAKLGIEALGFNATQRAYFEQAIKKPQGMILVTGPTGSGKTVSLYTALNILNTMETNILTAEDPVEIKIPGINQVNINPKAGLNFSNALRSFLRQDPDIIMVGEIRDLETAEIAVKAAQTGHLVLSTLHTNSAAESLTRLLNMGIPSFNIASSVSLLVAQRLTRKLCEHCKTIRDDFTVQSMVELGYSEDDAKTVQPYKAVGCNQCTQGYKGRVGIFEVMPMSKALGHSIMNGGNALEIMKQAQEEGMLTLYQAGLQKVKEGITSIEEVNRVTVD